MASSDLPTTSAPQPFTARGGAQLGWLNATAPMAQLEACAARLTLTVSLFGIFRLGRYALEASEVGSLELLDGWFGLRGVRIHHTRRDYPQKLIFRGPREEILDGIRASGFVAGAMPEAAEDARRPRGFAMRWGPLAIVAMLWNVLLGWDFFRTGAFQPQFGPAGLGALALVLSLSLGLQWSSALQHVFLKPGRHLGEVRPALILVAFISAIQFVVFSFLVMGGFSFPAIAPRK